MEIENINLFFIDLYIISYNTTSSYYFCTLKILEAYLKGGSNFTVFTKEKARLPLLMLFFPRETPPLPFTLPGVSSCSSSQFRPYILWEAFSNCSSHKLVLYAAVAP